MLEAKNFIDAFENIFGLLPQMEIIPSEIISLAKLREEARGKGDWAIADGLRKEIEKHGFGVEDTIKGYKIKKV